MAEAIALAASIIAVVQLADRVAGVCKSLIETVQDYPRDLRLIFVETGSLKVIFESLRFLSEDDPVDSAALQRLRGPDGPVEGCKTAMDQLDQLFPSLSQPGSKHDGAKRQKLQTALTRLAWPLKADRARKLLNEIMCHKSTINVALPGQLLTEFRSVKHRLDEVCISVNASDRQKVYEWYQDTNPSSSHNAAKELYENKTGDWVFRTSEWDDWINARTRALWIHGIPGAGKTILAAHMIEETFRICEAADKRTTCVYYYCYHGHNQDESVPFLRWLVNQLLREADQVPIIAWKAYNGQGARYKTFTGQRRQNLLTTLDVLATDLRFQKIQLLATSREYSDIELKMCLFSQPLSMSNDFVEADIKIYVTAKILSEAKFQRWPPDLRADVEATLATGAKGMFRWAVCQLDILRRLNSQSKIREAIKSLPKTMDETYERIFSYITDEEKELVRHTLHWVCFHDILWKGSFPLPARFLIDAYIAQDKGTSLISSDEYLYDLETLKDSCGCLVSFSCNNFKQSQSVNIAHYTVREFLESDRSSITSWFSIKRNNSYGLIVSFAMEYAMASVHLEASENWGWGSVLGYENCSSLHGYCSVTSIHSLRDFQELIEPRIAFRFLDPLEAHSKALRKILRKFYLEMGLFYPSNFHLGFWEVNWCESTKRSKTAILANLLLMRYSMLAKAFIQELDMKSVLQETISGFIEYDKNGKESFRPSKFECNLVEFFAQTRGLDLDVLELFQHEAHGLICYTEILPHYMPGHAYETVCASSCALPRLLQLGANPDPKGFRVTPLQIAVFYRDIAGVRELLEAGADPNNKGDEQGIKFHAEISIFKPYYHLHGLYPLYILLRLEAYSFYEGGTTNEEIDDMNGQTTADIERLLVDYGALTIATEE